MPTEREREYYAMGYRDGRRDALRGRGELGRGAMADYASEPLDFVDHIPKRKPKRKLSAWQKFVKANSKKPRFKYKSGRKKGMINLKALGVAYRKKKRR